MSPLSLVLLLVAVIIITAVPADQVTPGCDGQAEIVFLVDATNSTTPVSFNNSINFVYNVVSQLNIHPNTTRVAVVVVSPPAFNSSSALSTTCRTPDIRLSDHATVDSLLAGIDAVRRSVIENAGIDTFVASDLSSCLRSTVDEVLIEAKGGRPYIPRIVVMLLSGELIQTIGDAVESLQTLTATARYIISSGSILMSVVYDSWPEVNNIINNIVTKPASQYSFATSSFSEISSPFQTQLCLEIPACAGVADIVFVLDLTGSIDYFDWLTELDFVGRVVENLYLSADGVRVAMVTFDTQPLLRFGFNNYTNRYDLKNAISNIAYNEGAGTNTAGALRYVMNSIFSTTGTLGNRLAVRDVAIVVSDGGSNVNRNLTIPVARKAHDSGIEIFAIGVGSVDDNPGFETEMRGIASGPTDDHYFNVASFDDLATIENDLVLRTCRIPTVCRFEMDVVFVVDVSGVVGPVDYLIELNFVSRLVGLLDIDSGQIRVGVLVFGSEPRIAFNLNRYSTALDVQAALSQIGYIGGTPVAASAFRVARELMFRPENGSRDAARHVIVFINDGNTADAQDSIVEALKTRASGTDILSIGVGNWINLDVLQSYSSFPGSRNTLTAPDFNVMFQLLDLVISIVCSSEDVCLSQPCRNNGTCRNGFSGYTCICPARISGSNCELECAEYLDVVFAVDGSSSLEQQDFRYVLDFVRDIINGIDFSTGSRVGLLVFAENAQIIFNLKDFEDAATAVDAVNVPFPRGETNAAEAIRVVRQTMFSPENGDQPSARNLLILITDGISMDRDAAIQESVAAKNSGIHIIVVGAGEFIDLTAMNGYASFPSSPNVFIADSYEDLLSIETRLQSVMCNANDACASRPCLNNGTCRGGFSTFTCICQIGFTGTNCERYCSNEADVAFVVQMSGSVHWESIPIISTFITDSILELDIASGRFRVSLMTYNDTARVLLNLSSVNQINNYLYQASALPPPSGRNNLANALRTLRSQVFNGLGGDRPLVPNVAVLLINMLPTVEVANTVREAIALHQAGVYVILVTVGAGLNTGRSYITLRNIASEPIALNFLNVVSYSSLTRLALDVSQNMCNDVSPCKNNPCANNGTCVDRIKQYQCLCTDRFSGSTCTRECALQLDIVFVVDVSGSLELTGYDIHLSLIRSIVKGLNFQFGRTRVAYVTFARETKVQFGLETFSFAEDVNNAITVDAIETGTDIATALRTVRTQVLGDPSVEARPSATRICLLLSDGKANIAQSSTYTEADLLKTMPGGVILYTAAIGISVDENVMTTIASDPSEKYAATIQTRDDVATQAQTILDNICQL